MHTINSLLSHSLDTTTLKFNANQFYILITPMRAMHGLRALPQDRPDKRRNAVEYQLNSVTWCMTDGAFMF